MDSYEALYCDECGALVGFGIDLNTDFFGLRRISKKLHVSVLCSACMVVGGEDVRGAEKILLPRKSPAVDTLVETCSLAEAG